MIHSIMSNFIYHFQLGCFLSFVCKQESSAKLTNQRISYAFTSSPLSFHARHILPTSKFHHTLLIFYVSEQMCENCECEYSSLV